MLDVGHWRTALELWREVCLVRAAALAILHDLFQKYGLQHDSSKEGQASSILMDSGVSMARVLKSGSERAWIGLFLVPDFVERTIKERICAWNFLQIPRPLVF